MSVFQLHEWWGIQCCQEMEEFDNGSMCIGNIDNSTPSSNKIAVGSQQGFLRIYNPTRPQYKVDDLIFEDNLGEPILQLLLGQFIPSSPMNSLAVLHPRKLTVYELILGINNDRNNKDKANFHTINKIYQHDLGLGGQHFTAYNMCSGCFGGDSRRDMFLVQSMDGKLQIFEQSSNAFTRQLVDCLVPGPFSYLPRLDAFITSNYSCQVECYKYQVLASTQTELGTRENENKNIQSMTTGAFKLQAVRSALMEWTINLGESCRQITPGSFSKPTDSKSRGGNEILFLCDKSLFLLKDSGGVIQQKRLEQEPSCIYAYTPAGSNSDNFLLATQDCTLNVYSGFNLIWASKVPSVPVQLGVANFGDQKGLIVTLDEGGKLSLNYLGTKPPTNSVSTHIREPDYDKIDSEHRSLLQIIRESQTENKAEPRDKLIMRSQISRSLDKEYVPMDLPPYIVPSSVLLNSTSLLNNDSNGQIKICVRLFLSFSGEKSATSVSLAVSAPSFLHVAPKNIIIQSVSGSPSTPVMVKLYFYATRLELPSKLEAEIMATYNTSNGEPRIASHIISIPLSLACRLRPAAKTAQFKLTIDTEHPAQPLTDLFDDFLYSSHESGVDFGEILGNTATAAMGFQFWTTDYVDGTNNKGGTALVSILVSKTSGRYRIQSDSLAAIYIIASELDKRLMLRLKTLGEISNQSTRFVTCGDNIPIIEFFSRISSHFATRQQLQIDLGKLNDAAHQFRMIEKRLLVRFKDRNPTPLGGLDIIMKDTYHTLLALGNILYLFLSCIV